VHPQASYVGISSSCRALDLYLSKSSCSYSRLSILSGVTFSNIFAVEALTKSSRRSNSSAKAALAFDGSCTREFWSRFSIPCRRWMDLRFSILFSILFWFSWTSRMLFEIIWTWSSLAALAAYIRAVSRSRSFACPCFISAMTFDSTSYASYFVFSSKYS